MRTAAVLVAFLAIACATPAPAPAPAVPTTPTAGDPVCHCQADLVAGRAAREAPTTPPASRRARLPLLAVVLPGLATVVQVVYALRVLVGRSPAA